MPKLVVGCPGAVAEEYCLLQGGDFRGYVGDKISLERVVLLVS